MTRPSRTLTQNRARARLRGDNASADDPVPRGGRSARRPDRRDRPRSSDRAGHGSELKDRVGGQILEVELVSAAERDNARVALAGIGCGEPEPGERRAQLTLPAPRDGLEMIEDAASALRKAGIAVSDLGLRRPTLDDVFLQLTGAPPSENGAEAEVASADGQPKRARPSTPTAPAARFPSALRPVARRPSRWRRLSPRELRADIVDARVVSVRNLRHFVRRGAVAVLCVVRARGLERVEDGVLIVSLDRLVAALRVAAGTSRRPAFLAVETSASS
jgi:hypothetical protein